MEAAKLLMIVPYKARDLEGHALVAHHLKKRYGHEVIFSNGYGIERKLLEHAPDALVLDHLSWDFKVRQARLAKDLGMKVVVQPTEGLFQDKEGAVRRAGKLHGATHLVDCYLAWGDFPRKAILEQGLMTESQIHAIGCPRFDFYKEPYRSLGQPRDVLLGRLGVANPDRPMILWATNTSYASRSSQKMIRRQVARAKKPEAEVRAHIRDHVTQMREHSNVVMALAQRHPDWNFVIKVHPAEWINPYFELVKRSSNVYLAFDAPIRDFLFHCDVLIQRNCTTATEAWMLGKPVLNLEVGQYLRPVREEYRTGNDVVANLEEADHMIQEYLSGRAIPYAQQRARDMFIADFYFRIDGMASERAAELIHQTLSPPRYCDEDRMRVRNSARNAYLHWKRSEGARAANRLKDFLGLDRRLSLRFWKKLLRREAEDNLGMFNAEAEITPSMVDELYRRYELAGASAPLCVN